MGGVKAHGVLASPYQYGLGNGANPMMPYKTRGAQPTRYAAGKRRAETNVHGLEQLPDLRGRANKRPQRALAKFAHHTAPRLKDGDSSIAAKSAKSR